MKKFTLLSNDKDLNFKMNQAWDLSFPKTIIKNAYCHKYFIELIETRKRHTGDNWAKNVFSLELYKGNNKIIYEIEDIKLHLKGDGKKIKIISIEVLVDEDTNKAKIKINAQQELSFSEKLSELMEDLIDKVVEIHNQRIENKVKKRLDVEGANKAFIENIIEKKAKETITNEY